MVNDVERLFRSASGFFGQNAGIVDTRTQLLLYGLYKQAIIGPIEKSSIMCMISTDPKVRAWHSCRALSQDEAKMKYVEEVAALNLGWSKENADEHGSIDQGFGIRPSQMCSSGVAEDTPFQRFYNSVRKGDIEKMKAILAEHPDLAFQRDDTDGTPMHWAADANQPDMIRYLYNMRYLVSDVDNEGQTPLHLAAICEYPECISTLLDLGANPKAVDSDGNTALDILQGNSSLLDIFSAVGLE